MFVLRVVACAFAFVCCNIAVHVALVCILHACFVFVYLVCLFALVCNVSRLILYAFAFDCCKVVFHITRVCTLYAWFAFVFSVFVFMIVCFLFVWLCMRLLLCELHFCSSCYVCCKVAFHVTRV